MHERLQNAAMQVADWVMAAIPRPMPELDALQSCRLVSHRGEHDNRSIIENTLPAFEQARLSGVWGIECDIRWSADLVPLICHDADGGRLFGQQGLLRELPFTEIRERMPLIPTLEELVAEFGGNMHLMLEIKAEPYPDPAQQKQCLMESLGGLQAGLDYHFLALDVALYEQVDFVAPRFFFPVAELDAAAMSRRSLEAGFGGLTGHYLLMNESIRQEQLAAGRRIGTGFINSRNCLFRELNRGVEWMFSNRAVDMQNRLDRLLEAA